MNTYSIYWGHIDGEVLVVVMLAHKYIRNFWVGEDRRKAGMRVPLPKMGDFNEARRATEQLLEILNWLEYTWVLTSVLGVLGGYGGYTLPVARA